MITVKVIINGEEAAEFELTSTDMISFSVDDASSELVQSFMRDCADAITDSSNDVRLH